LARAAPTPDRRVERTRRVLHEALIAEILVKGYEAVTVQDVIDRADVGRSTFYTHYADKEALLIASVGQLHGFLTAHRHGDQPLAFTRAMFEHVFEQRDLGRAIFGRKSGAAMQAQIRRMFAELVRDDLAPLVPKRRAPPVALDLVVEVVVATFMAMIGWWLDRRTGLAPAEIDGQFRALVMPGIDAGLGR
jgi:AcrR family transcriptional regulator